MATLQERLNEGIRTAFNSGIALVEDLLPGTSPALNIEGTLAENVSADKSLTGHCQVVGRPPRPIRPLVGGYVDSMRSVFPFEVIITLDEDVGQSPKHEKVYQAFLQALDPESFFATHLNDAEGNLHILDGDIELDPIVIQGPPTRPEIVTEVRITCWHKTTALTQ